MNRTCCWVGIACALMCLVQVTAAIGQAKETDEVAIIEQIEGKVYFKPNQKAKPLLLNKSRDVLRSLHFGEWVKVMGGTLKILRPGRDNKEYHEILHGNTQWVTFPHQPTAEQVRWWTTLQKFSEFGGRWRNVGTGFFAPAENSFVRPDFVTIHWIPLRDTERVTLTIFDQQHHELWSQNDVHGDAGQFQSEVVRTALKNFRDSGHSGGLVLALSVDAHKPKMIVHFSLLDPVEEQELQAQLAECETQNGLIRHIARAQTFMSRKVYSEAADEYEAALAQSPESTSLLMATILAEEQIGNTPRGEELRKCLPKDAHVPGDL